MNKENKPGLPSSATDCRPENMASLYRDNAELIRLAQRLVLDGESILSSRTWNIGYFFSGIFRRVSKILGLSTPHQHISPGHFKRLAYECPCFYRSTAASYPLNGKLDRIPPHYLPMDVDEALEQLWDNLQKDNPYVTHEH